MFGSDMVVILPSCLDVCCIEHLARVVRQIREDTLKLLTSRSRILLRSNRALRIEPTGTGHFAEAYRDLRAQHSSPSTTPALPLTEF